VYERFGKPEKDQILKGGTLRLIYSYEHSEPARRVFLLQPHNASMFLMTDAYVARLDRAQAQTERASGFLPSGSRVGLYQGSSLFLWENTSASSY
jgi:hypothetical protein